MNIYDLAILLALCAAASVAVLISSTTHTYARMVAIVIMTALAPHLSCYLREHLPNERRASQHTCEAYAQGFQLLLCFAAGRLKIKPAKIEIEGLDATLILAFLEHLEKKRGNSPRTRNARLAAINSFFRYLEYRVPSCLDQSRRIHAIPMKKTAQPLVAYLTRDELQALLDAPNADKVTGIRDRAMLHLAFAAGMYPSVPTPRIVLGEAVVVAVRERTATVRILNSNDAIMPGDKAELQ